MNQVFKDRYFILCAAIAAILLISSFFDVEDDSGGEAGIVRDVSSSSNGHTFYLDLSTGNSIYCFYKGDISDGSLCSVDGSWSDDGSIFFVSDVELL